MKLLASHIAGFTLISKTLAVIAILPLLCTSIVFSQTDSLEFNTQEIINKILEEPQIESDNEDVYGIIEDLSINPIDLNSASVSELQRIPALSSFYADKIIQHRNKFGYFFSLSELKLIEGLPANVIEMAVPFLRVDIRDGETQNIPEKIWDVGSIPLLERFKVKFRSRVSNDLQERRGFSENKYQGSSQKIYNRLLINYDKHISAALITEKDAGEKSFNEFTSFHAALQNYGFVKTFVVGDYTLEFGQGLALWSPFALSKGSEAIYPLKQRGKTINPYKSTNENNFFRGAAATIEANRFSFSTFYSNNFFDANIDSISRYILSTPIDGFHRTESEIKKRKTARETLYGARIDYSTQDENIRAGILYYTSKFSNPFLKESPFDLEGDKFSYYSLYYDLYFGMINLFGESAFDGRSVATLASASISITKDFSFIALLRNYPRSYNNLHAYGFGENAGSTKNEVGIYTGIQLRTFAGEINFYYDQFKFPYATFENPLPSSGGEFLFDLRSQPFNKVETNLRIKYEKKEITLKINNLDQLVPRLRQSLRGEVIYDLSKAIRLKSRVEYCSYAVNKIALNENGMMAFQDIRYSPSQNLSLTARILLFQTDSFNSAIYEYENDLTGILSNVALFGKGVRWYLLVKFKPIEIISISAKYSETYKPLEMSISSGFSEIRNNVDNKINVQLDISF